MFRSITNRAKRLYSKIPYKKIVFNLQKHPFLSFFSALAILLIVIVLGNIVRSLDVKKAEKPNIVKSVQTYNIDKTPAVSTLAKVEKQGVIKIAAQTAGIVQSIHVSEGNEIAKGNWIVSLSSSYQGGDAQSIQAQIARKQYQNLIDTYDTQKGIIENQRSLTNESRENTEQLRKITDESLSGTHDLINLNKDIVSSVDQQLNALSQAPLDDATRAQILQSKSLKSQFLSSVNQLQQLEKTISYQVDTANSPGKLADLQKDAALKQLDVQEKALNMQKDISALQVTLASIGESLMHPSSPLTGIVQRVFVRPGQVVSPGMPIAVVSQQNHSVYAVAQVPYGIATSVSKDTKSTVSIGDKKISITPAFVSSEATDGQLYSIRYDVPPEFENLLTDGQHVSINIPIHVAHSETLPLIPLDSVYQTQNESFVFVAKDGIAKAKKVTLGDVFGQYVRVEKGLSTGDVLIITRNVIENDKVKLN